MKNLGEFFIGTKMTKEQLTSFLSVSYIIVSKKTFRFLWVKVFFMYACIRFSIYNSYQGYSSHIFTAMIKTSEWISMHLQREKYNIVSLLSLSLAILIGIIVFYYFIM